MLNKTEFKKTSLAMAMTLVSTGVMAAQLEEVVVTAQKRQQSLQDVPISLDVISADQLSDRGISSIDGLAQATPSLVLVLQQITLLFVVSVLSALKVVCSPVFL